MANNPDDRHFLTPAPGYFLIMAHHHPHHASGDQGLETLLYDTFETYLSISRSYFHKLWKKCKMHGN